MQHYLRGRTKQKSMIQISIDHFPVTVTDRSRKFILFDETSKSLSITSSPLPGSVAVTEVFQKLLLTNIFDVGFLNKLVSSVPSATLATDKGGVVGVDNVSKILAVWILVNSDSDKCTAILISNYAYESSREIVTSYTTIYGVAEIERSLLPKSVDEKLLSS